MSLAAAHLAGDGRAATWLGPPWSGAAAAAAHARELLAGGRWDRPTLATFAPQLADPASVTVVAGQQPAVGGGPLYILVKTAQAIALARQLTAAGVPAVPWFWCASEDHDLGEAGHADLVLRDGSIERVSADLGGGRAALRWRPAARWWTPLVERCRTRFGAGLGGAWLEQHAPRGDEGMGAWLCRILPAVFTGSGLVAVEAHRLRELWAAALPGLRQVWPAAELAARRAELLAAGQPDSFGDLPEPPLFRDRPDGRTPWTGEACPAGELSPGAALRPVLQQLALPAAMAVLGPGELAYHAAIGPAYPALGARRPLLVSRISATLLPAWAERACSRLGLDPAALADGAPLPAADAIAHPGLAALDQAIAGLGDGSDPRIAAAQVRLRRTAARLAASLERGRRTADSLPAPGSLRAVLRPRGQPQDRTLSLFQVLWEHGPGIGPALVAAAGAEPGGQVLLRPR